MKSEIITIGSELTLGLAADTNGLYIARKLAERGISVSRIATVPDDLKMIVAAIKESLGRCGLLIMTGGLGPTADDLTRYALSEAVGQQLIYDGLLAEMLKSRFTELQITPPDLVYRQAYRPERARAIAPLQGTAPGLVLEIDSRTILAFPGVPREMGEMLDGQLPGVAGRYGGDRVLYTRVIKTCGASEAVIEEKVEDLVESSPELTVTILGHVGEVHLQLTAAGGDREEAKGALMPVVTDISNRLGDLVFGRDSETLEAVVGSLLRKHGQTLAVAESSTGGLVAKRMTNVAGSSDYFLGGIVAYSYELKHDLLGVSPKVLLEHGAVSAATAEAMASGIRARVGADLGVAVTGIAGPGGATPDKPVGLTFIAISSGPEARCERFVFSGERGVVRTKTAQTALNLLRLFIRENFEPDDEAS